MTHYCYNMVIQKVASTWFNLGECFVNEYLWLSSQTIWYLSISFIFLGSNGMFSKFFSLFGPGSAGSYLDGVGWGGRKSSLFTSFVKMKWSHLGLLHQQIKRGNVWSHNWLLSGGCPVSSNNSWNHSLGTRWLPFNPFAFFIRLLSFKAVKSLN